RAGADHDDGRHGAHRSTLLRRVGDVPAEDRGGHRRLIGQQEEERADRVLGPSDSADDRQCASSAPALAARYCGGSITPRAMRLKRTRCCAISFAALLANATSAALLAA